MRLPFPSSAWHALSKHSCFVLANHLQGVVLKSHKVVSFAQRKALLASLKDSAKKYETCEQKMIAMDPLTVRHLLPIPSAAGS